ncbi:MAG: hypothetical protein U9Q12_03670 [Patescibacteria group bacterium]|nr:hypothetical protein [Patescibacteria group bacterium]
MKSWHYIVIFVAVVAVVGGLIWYNASTIDDIDSEVVTIEKTSATKQGDQVVVEKEINVLTDADIEMDELDFVEEMDMSEFDDLDDLIEDEVVEF